MAETDAGRYAHHGPTDGREGEVERPSHRTRRSARVGLGRLLLHPRWWLSLLLAERRDQAGLSVRLWSLHPLYLDARGLLALWREGLLARSVLLGRTTGYRHHPQLERFRNAADPVAAIETYLHHVLLEALRRGYRFRALAPTPGDVRLKVTTGQLAYELAHLRAKLERRDPARARELPRHLPEPHPLFEVVPGPVESWERTTAQRKRSA